MDKSALYFGDVNKHLKEVLEEENYTQLIVLVDENTILHCLPLLELPSHHVIQIESGEKNKNVQTCQAIWADLLSHQADRQALLINLGGGVIGDMGGFCAATYKRGIRFINIPTTLLSMVDASVGGKTGVDFMNQKNMIGLFTEPLVVCIDPIFLRTLAMRQIQSGKAEMLKHGLIAKEEHYLACLPANTPGLELIKESIAIKETIVNKDPLESGIRKALNFGHTLGHSIESIALSEGLDILHGEAIAQGMILELHLSVHYAGLEKHKANAYIEALSTRYSTPKQNTHYLNELIDLSFNDKKNNDSGINFTLLAQAGEAKLDFTLSREEILKIAVD